MTTGVSIYLVSACSSPEEFVAAFRRYTDRIGLFIPTTSPVSTGKRGRIAITLTSGAVMLEGEAEVVSSSTRASALYGRVGMTIRFVSSDDASKAVLDELDKARIAPRPLSEGIVARPAVDLPAEPRPVPPAAAGRIDAANALAECVVIGDVSAVMKGGASPLMGAPTPAAALPVVQETKKRPTIPPPSETGPIRKSPTIPPAPPSVPPIDALRKPPTIPPPSSTGTGPIPLPTLPKAGQKFVVPTVPPVSRTITRPPPTPPAGEPVVDAPIAKRPTVDSAPIARPPTPSGASAPLARPPTPPPVEPAAEPVIARRPTVESLPFTRPAAEPAVDAPVETAPSDDAPATIAMLPLERPPIARAPTPAPVEDSLATIAMEPLERPPVAPPPTPIAKRPTVESAPLIRPPAPTPPGPVATSLDTPVSGVPATPAFVPATTLPGGPAFLPATTQPDAKPPDAASSSFSDLFGSDAKLPPAEASTSFSDLFGTSSPPPAIAIPRAETKPGLAEALREPAPARPIEQERTDPTPTPTPKPPSAPIVAAPPPTPARKVDTTRATMLGAPAMVLPPTAPATPAPPPARPTVIGQPAVLVPPAPPTPVEAKEPSTKTTQPSAVVPPPAQPKSRAERDATLRGVMPAAVRAQIMAGQPVSKQMWEVSDDADERTDLTTPPTPGSTPRRHIKVTEPPTPSEPRDTAVMDIEPGFEPDNPGAELASSRRDVTEPGRAPSTPPAVEAVAPAAADVDEVAGDWTMTPDAPAPVPLEVVTTAPKPRVEDDWTRSPSSGSEKEDEILSSGPPESMVVSSVPLSSEPKGESPVVDEGPKIQIDPTLIEALPNLEDPPSIPSPGTIPPNMAFATTPPAGSEQLAAPPPSPTDAPAPMPPMMTPAPIFARPATPLPLQPVVYTPVGQQVPPIVPPQQRMVTDAGTNWFRDSQADIGYRSEEHTAHTGDGGKKRRLIVIAVSAVLAVAIGLIVLLATTGGSDDEPKHKPDKPDKPDKSDKSDHALNPPPTNPVTPDAATVGATTPADAQITVETPDAAVADEITTCFTNVTSQPSGADVAVDNGPVLAKTPARVEIPCGKKVKVYFRLANMGVQSRTVTGTAAESTIPVVQLTKATFTVKITSTPSGAAVTINGKSSGVTPSNVTLPAYDTVDVKLSKAGFTAETRKLKVTQGATLSVTLTKKSR